MTRIQRAILAGMAGGILAVGSAASAQVAGLPFQPSWLQGPTVAKGNYQVNYPYPGQCFADTKNAPSFPGLLPCTASGSFACRLGFANQSAGGWAKCGTVDLFPAGALSPLLPNSLPPVGTPATPKFAYDVLNPLDYAPDTTSFPGAEYYEIGLHEAQGFQAIASAGLFPNPKVGPGVPAGMQWTGILCNRIGGCNCSPLVDQTTAFGKAYCPGGKVPQGAPLFTQIWGVGQVNGPSGGGGPVTALLSSGTCGLTYCATGGNVCLTNADCLTPGDTCGPKACNTTAAASCPGLGDACTGKGPLGIPPLFKPGAASAWSANNYVATWPSISIRGKKGTPVVVKWVNEFPNNHVFCPHPEAADWPCAIDRTFMGVKARLDPAVAESQLVGVLPDAVNQYGSPQQPDNSWVTHLHGGEIPPTTDGFAEKWFGNADTAPLFNASGKPRYVTPPFESPLTKPLSRPAGNSDTYTYPMVQEEALIWFHDHTLGKTHHNVIAGPAGFFPVTEPLKHGAVSAGVCQGGGKTCEYTWLDPLTVPRDAIGIPVHDLFFAIQDRSFNDDGSINFSNSLGQLPLPPGILPQGTSQYTIGVNPQVHPTWVPEYFGDHVLVNGVLWPKKTVAPGWYRIRLVDGSDSRCWQIGFSTKDPGPFGNPKNDIPFWVIANDQGYMQTPVFSANTDLVMCPGERYELLVDFSAVVGSAWLTNKAPAPFPAGLTPMATGSPYGEMTTIMRFDVNAALAGIKTCAGLPPAGQAYPTTFSSSAQATGTCIPSPATILPDPVYAANDQRKNVATATVRQVYLNERFDGITLAPMGMQLNGVPFEYKVTETPVEGTTEVWKFVNLTVDAHPMHPHLVKHQIVSRQTFNVGTYKSLLCGSAACQPGTAPGNEMQYVPDVTAAITAMPVVITPLNFDGGFKDATIAYPGDVTTIVAKWEGRFNQVGAPNAPGTAGCPNGTKGCAAPYVYDAVTSGPFVWHCHINSHEDSEMMRTSLVVPKK